MGLVDILGFSLNGIINLSFAKTLLVVILLYKLATTATGGWGGEERQVSD